MDVIVSLDRVDLKIVTSIYFKSIDINSLLLNNTHLIAVFTLLQRIRRLETENNKKEEEKRNLAHQKAALCFVILNHNCRLNMTLRPSSGKLVSLLK